MSSKRPLPGIENTPPGAASKEGMESDSGRPRHVSSQPRRLLPSGKPNAAIKKLKQRMTFSDQSATSSAKSTPSKVTRKPTARTDPHPGAMGRSRGGGGASGTDSMQRPRQKSYMPQNKQKMQSSMFVPAPSYASDEASSKGHYSDYASEGEIPSALTVSSLLSKLDSIKDYMKQAEAMRVGFSSKRNEPEMAAQLKKLDKLIDQLQQQESGYLGELLRITEMEDPKFNGSMGGLDVTYSEEEEEEEEEDEDEDGGGSGFVSDEEDNVAVPATERSSHRKSASAEGSSLSLRAETELEKQAEQELLDLQKQKEMLTQLLEKQKQIQELEAKQTALLEMKNKAELQLKAAEAKGRQIEKLSEEAENSRPELSERDMLMAKFSELKERKQRVDRITEMLLTLKNEEELDRAPLTLPLPSEAAASRGAAAQESANNVARQVDGKSEMVAAEEDEDVGPNMALLQEKLRMATEARKKLLKAQKYLALQTEAATGEGRPNEGESQEATLRSWKTEQSQRKEERGEEEEEEEEEESRALEHSMISDYESKLSAKREEVAHLLREREELKATHNRLLALQKKMHTRQLSDDPSKPNPEHDIASQTDLTAATWGGSTVQSDPEEDTASSVSLPSDIAADITQESLVQNVGGTLDRGGSATVEQAGRGKTPPFTVTRHTPRERVNVRLRMHSIDSTEAALHAGKKIKVEPHAKPQPKRKGGGGGPKNPLSPAAVFKPSTKPRTDFTSGTGGGGGGVASFGPVGLSPGAKAATTTTTTTAPGDFQPSSLPATSAAAAGGPAPDLTVTQTLQNQLALTSHMCSQLLYGQNNLIRAVCNRLDRPPEFPPGIGGGGGGAEAQLEERMAMLQQYQMELEAYYQQLYASFAQLCQRAEEEGTVVVVESEEPVVAAGGASEAPPPQGDPSPAPPAPAPATAGAPKQAQAAVESQGVSDGLFMDPRPAIGVSFPKPPAAAAAAVGSIAGPGGAATVPMGLAVDPFLLPPPPPMLANPYGSPQHWMYRACRPSLQMSPPQPPPVMGGVAAAAAAAAGGADQTPLQFYPERPPNPTFGGTGAFFGPYYAGKAYGPLGLNTSFDSQGAMPPFMTAEPGFPGGSQVSTQVHAPSSSSTTGPRIDQSTSIQPNAVSASHLKHPSAGGGLAAAGHVETMVGAQGGSATAAAAAAAERKEEEEKSGGNKDGDGEESMSSLPMDVPEGAGVSEGEGLSAGLSVFDTLRDTIYSEVATLIASNENRPHFLVELFRELQMLNTDYLRQRALYNLQELVTRYLTEEAVANQAKDKQYRAWLAEVDSGCSESEGGSSQVRSKLPLLNKPTQGFDYVEAVNSASSVSTPSNEPFASDDLGETVIKMDGAITLNMASAVAGGQGPTATAAAAAAVTPPAHLKGEEEEEDEEEEEQGYPDIDTRMLDEQIKGIMMKIIPLLKEDIEKTCSLEMVVALCDRVVGLVMEHEQQEGQGGDYLATFRKQLEVGVKSAMEKYCGQKLRECGEDLLMDVSEVLFSELTFFRLMEDFKGHPQLNSDFQSASSSQATTEPEDNASFAEVVGGAGAKALDPALLQMLSYAANLTLQEEEDALGKTRDDSLATAWDPKHRSHEQSSPSADELDPPMEMVELSVSESQPIQSVGSEEEKERSEEEGVETPTPTNHQAVGGGAERGVASPTLVAVAPAEDQSGGSGVAPTTADPLSPKAAPLGGGAKEEADEGNASIGKVSTISKEDSSETDLPALSPPAAMPPAAQDSLVPQITLTVTEGALEAQMKAEQRSMEGAEGILAAMGEQGDTQDPGLVGDDDGALGPATSNGI